MWKLPQKKHGVQDHRLHIQSAGGCGPTNERRHGTRKSSDENAHWCFSLQRGVHEQIGQQRQSCKHTREQVDSCREIDAASHRQCRPESQDCRRCEAAGGGWTPGGSTHLRVELSFEVLVKRPGPTCYQQRSEQSVEYPCE